MQTEIDLPTSMNLAHLPSWDSKSGACNVIIETMKGYRNKFKYEPETATFMLCKVLPCGAVFPYDFGFIPSTAGDDGDPLDVLVLMDTPCFPGCRIRCRLIGVLEAEQTENGKTLRNDRMLAVAEDSHDNKDIHSIKDLNKHLLKEVEEFFISYNEAVGKQFKPLSWRGPHRAKKLVQEGIKSADRTSKHLGNGEPGNNGRSKVKKERPPAEASRK
jgi:inorganic pyrophosphatase